MITDWLVRHFKVQFDLPSGAESTIAFIFRRFFAGMSGITYIHRDEKCLQQKLRKIETYLYLVHCLHTSDGFRHN